MRRDGNKDEEQDSGDTTSTEGLIEDEEEDEKKVSQQATKEVKADLDLLDSAFLRDGITLEPEESSQSDDDSDGLYNFKDTLGVPEFPADAVSTNYAAYSRPPKQCEYLYGKRYTARCVRRVDPSKLPSLMSLKVEPPPSERVSTPRRIVDDDPDLLKLVRKLQKPPRRRRGSPEPRRRSPSGRRHRDRSRSPYRRLSNREKIHRSPTGIERYRYWTGREYRSRIRSPPHRRSRHT